MSLNPLPAPLPVAGLPFIPSSLEASTGELEALSSVKAGEQFVWGGFQYIATEKPVAYTRNGFEGVFVRACRVNPAMRSGWELADVSTSRRV